MEMRALWVVPSRSALTSTERFNLSLTARLGCVPHKARIPAILAVPFPAAP